MSQLSACPLCGGPMSWCKDVPDEDGHTHECDQLTCTVCKYNVDFQSDDVRVCETFEGARAIVAARWNRRSPAGAPAGVSDERAAFEDAMRKMWTAGYAFPRNSHGDYAHANCDLAWRVWQARAAFAPTPITDEQILELARREADEDKHCFTFNKDGRFSVLSFARALLSASSVSGENAPGDGGTAR